MTSGLRLTFAPHPRWSVLTYEVPLTAKRAPAKEDDGLDCPLQVLPVWADMSFEGSRSPCLWDVSPQVHISQYADSVASHLAKILDSDQHSDVISSAK